MYYTIEGRIRYSEIDHHGTVTLPGIINYFQDCSTFQSEDIGEGRAKLAKKKRAWILSYWQVIVTVIRRWAKRSRWGRFPPDSRGFSESGIL